MIFMIRGFMFYDWMCIRLSNKIKTYVNNCQEYKICFTATYSPYKVLYFVFFALLATVRKLPSQLLGSFVPAKRVLVFKGR